MEKSAEEIVSMFKEHLTNDGKSSMTIESYVGDVKGFIKYLESMGTEYDNQIHRFHITNFKNHLMESGYQPTTVNKKINSLMSFNNFLMDVGVMDGIVVDLKKDRVKVAAGSEKQVEVYNEHQLERLLFYIQSSRKVSARDRMIIQILMFTGIRVSELCSIRAKNIDFLTGQLKITGKGGKIREVPLKEEVMDSIREYMAERSNNPYSSSEYLILGQRGSIQRDAVNTLLEKHMIKGGFDVKLKPHTFRHTFCTRLIKKGVPLTTVSKLAGHSSIETTARFYVNSSKEDKMRAVNLL